MNVGEYHEYARGCSVHWGFHTNSIVFPMTFPHIYHDIPPCTENLPLYCTDIMKGDLHLKYFGVKSNYVKIRPEHKVVDFEICVARDDDKM